MEKRSKKRVHHLVDMNEGSDDENYLPKSAKRCMLGSFSSTPPIRRSPRLQSRDREKLNNCRAHTEIIKLTQLARFRVTYGRRLLDKQNKRDDTNSPTFSKEEAVSDPKAGTSKQDAKTAYPDNHLQENKNAEDIMIDKQAGVTREEIKAQTPRDTARRISPSMASHRNVQGVETVCPDDGDRHGDNEGGGRCILEHLSCKSTDAASLLRTASAFNNSSSSNVPSHVEDAGERIVMAEQELEGAPEKANETHIPGKTAVSADTKRSAILMSIASRQDVQDAEIIFPDTARQGDTEGDWTSIPDNMSCKSIGPSLFEMANNFHDISSDATSSLDNTAQVGPYCMSLDLAPTLCAIILKHGDIGSGCRLKSPAMVRDLLEKVCKAVQNLQMPFKKLKESDLASLNDIIVVAEGVKLDVEWLRRHYDELRETVDLIPQYKNLKYNLTKKSELVEMRKRILELKKLEILKLQSECRMMDTELEKIGEQVDYLKRNTRNINPKLRRFHNKLAGNGLL